MNENVKATQIEFDVVGRVERIGEVVSYDKSGAGDPNATVANMHIAITAENEYGIETEAIQRVVLFKDMAKAATDTLKTGDFVFFSRVTGRPQEFDAKSGDTVRTIDLVVNQVKPVKISKTKFEEIKNKVGEKMLKVMALLQEAPAIKRQRAELAPAGSESATQTALSVLEAI